MSGRVALVTGAASGIGEAIARQFAAAGGNVVVVDVDGTRGEEVAGSIGGGDAEARFLHCDLRSEADIAKTVEQTYSTFGRLDVVVNAAGVHLTKQVHETTLEEWDTVQDVNIRAPFLMSKNAVARWLEDGTPGSIVNVASIAGMQGEPGAAAYSTSKHAMVGLTRVLAAAYAHAGIRCNVVSPGSTRTPLLEDWLASAGGQGDDLLARLQRVYPSGRLLSPDEVASVVCFLASDQASGVNGVNVPIDGGLTATLMLTRVL